MMTNYRPIDEIDHQIFNFIKQFIKENMYAPCLREIVKNVDRDSLCTIRNRLEKLRTHGFLDYTPKTQRSLRLLVPELDPLNEEHERSEKWIPLY